VDTSHNRTLSYLVRLPATYFAFKKIFSSLKKRLLSWCVKPGVIMAFAKQWPSKHINTAKNTQLTAEGKISNT
jgi:hypothetical protein